MKKRFALPALTGVLLAATTVVAGADTNSVTVDQAPNVQYNINGTQQALTSDYLNLYYQGHYYVPIRFVSEKLGATVDWDNDSQTISITSPPAVPKTDQAAMVNTATVNAYFVKASMLQTTLTGLQGQLSLNFVDQLTSQPTTTVDFSQADNALSDLKSEGDLITQMLQDSANAAPKPQLVTAITNLYTELSNESQSLHDAQTALGTAGSDSSWQTKFQAAITSVSKDATAFQNELTYDQDANTHDQYATFNKYSPVPEDLYLKYDQPMQSLPLPDLSAVVTDNGQTVPYQDLSLKLTTGRNHLPPGNPQIQDTLGNDFGNDANTNTTITAQEDVNLPVGSATLLTVDVQKAGSTSKAYVLDLFTPDDIDAAGFNEYSLVGNITGDPDKAKTELLQLAQNWRVSK